MSSGNSDQQVNNDLKTTAFWLLVAFFLGWGALILRIAMQAWAANIGLPAYRATTLSSLATETETAFIWSLAWLTAAFLFGFIFGIPKVIAATTSTTNPALNDPSEVPAPKLKVNTNLEDISDWLTKVLVGASLTQIVKIPDAIGRCAQFMSLPSTGEAISFNAGLLVYYSALGFLSGYILTRMFFARAFALSDQGPTLSPEAAKTLDSTNVGFGHTASVAAIDPSVRKAAVASESVPITDSLSGDQALRLAKGATLTGDLARALSASKLAVQKSPEDPQAQLTYAWSLRKLGASIEAVLPLVEGAAQKLSSNSDPAILSSVYNSLAFLWLYNPPPAGYQNALRALGEYDAKGGTGDAGIEINRACAFGQQYSYLQDQKPESAMTDAEKDELAKARDGALSAVRKALALDPSSVVRLKQLLWVTADPGDDDLKGFQGDQDFTTILPRS
jgi:hypothetical protein